ncbi:MULTISPECIES: cytochrome P450 [Sphingobium]|uniref:cytochrome P450 n=1 Tax=Sphingobium sp. MI1205 TaxID=407020 RepID=UPI0007704D04|nr:cytochrome P450 [Sphingobium sp. MI1205]AMK19643.1 cytochrome P450 [Sphingobium sp. MI1205]
MFSLASEVPHHVPPECVVDFDYYRLTDDGTDFFEAWKKLQRSVNTDMVWTPRNGGHWIAVRGKLIQALFTDNVNLSSAVTGVPRETSIANFIPLQSDPPMHAIYRAPVVRGLGAKYILGLQGTIRSLTRELINAFKHRGGCEFVDDFAEQMPFGVFLTLIGLPLSDREMLRQVGTQLSRPVDKTAEEVVALVSDYLRPYVIERLEQPGDDLISRILATPIDGRAWTLDEAMRLSLNMLIGGLDTVAAMIGFVTYFLACSPDHQTAIREDREIIPRAADEFIRRFGMVTNARVAVRDIQVGELTLRTDDIVLLPTMLHNLDDEAFPNAMKVDFNRGLCRHSTMGGGAHRCVGAGLAREELIAFLEEWFDAVPEFELDPARSVRMSSGPVASMTCLPLRWA